MKLIPLYPVVSGLLANPRVKIVIDDGRRWLRNHRGQGFDVVIMNTTFHWRSFASNVLSVEFLRLAGSVLNTGGIVMFNATGSSEVHRTAALAFPNAMRFANLMVGSRDRIEIDVERWEAVMKGYFIEGEPVLGEGESGRAALARNKARLRAVDRLGANRRQLGQRRDPPAHPRAHPRLARGDRRQYGTRMVPALTAYRSLTTGPSKAAPLLPVM